MALSGKDVDMTKVRSCKRLHRSNSCNKVVDMPVEVQRQEPMVSSNRSRENDYDSVTTNSQRSQCCDEETTNVRVTGVPMRTKRMSTSADRRVGQLVTTTWPKSGVGMQTLMYENSTTPRRPHNTRLETQPHNNRVGALV